MKKVCAWASILMVGSSLAKGLPAVESLTERSQSRSTQVEQAEDSSVEELRAPLKIGQRLDALQQEVQDLRGMVEELQYQVQSLSQGGGVRSSTPASLSQPVSSSGSSGSPSSGAGEKALYQAAYQQLQARQYDVAVESLKKLLAEYPKGEYAPSAYYWLGEVSLIQGHLDEAEQSFSMVYDQFHSNAKASDSLLKLGFVAYTKGDFPKAKQLLQKVLKEYPDTSPARLAQARLQKMKQDGQ